VPPGTRSSAAATGKTDPAKSKTVKITEFTDRFNNSPSFFSALLIWHRQWVVNAENAEKSGRKVLIWEIIEIAAIDDELIIK
jgi:hypothetical protein